MINVVLNKKQKLRLKDQIEELKEQVKKATGKNNGS